MPIQVAKQGQSLPAPPGGLQSFSVENLRAPFGFKAVEHDGKFYWEPGTEGDFRKSEAERLGIEEDNVNVLIGCVQTGPMTCTGQCSGGFCTAAYNPQGHYYYCTCA